MFVGISTVANAGVPASKAGLAAALLVGSIALLVAALAALRIANTRGETERPEVPKSAPPQTVA